MLLADKITCELPTSRAASLTCNLPTADLLDWITGLGTASAALAAVCFGIVEIVRSTKERERLKIEHERQLLNSQFQKITNIMAEIAEAFPLNTASQSNRFHAQVTIYENLLSSSREVAVSIKQNAGSLFTRFGTIALQNNAANNKTTRDIYDSNTRSGVDSQILPQVILLMLSMRLETALSAWHASGIGMESAAAELKELDSDMAEYEKRINDYGLIWKPAE